jgi:hypothetical protein
MEFIIKPDSAKLLLRFHLDVVIFAERNRRLEEARDRRSVARLRASTIIEDTLITIIDGPSLAD